MGSWKQAGSCFAGCTGCGDEVLKARLACFSVDAALTQKRHTIILCGKWCFVCGVCKRTLLLAAPKHHDWSPHEATIMQTQLCITASIPLASKRGCLRPLCYGSNLCVGTFRTYSQLSQRVLFSSFAHLALKEGQKSRNVKNTHAVLDSTMTRSLNSCSGGIPCAPLRNNKCR